MDREQKLKAIYQEMANKERSMGCEINVKYQGYYHGQNSEEISYTIEDDLIVGVDGLAKNGDIELNESDLLRADPKGYIEDLEVFVKTIGHPVMIGDVLKWIDKEFPDHSNHCPRCSSEIEVEDGVLYCSNADCEVSKDELEDRKNFDMKRFLIMDKYNIDGKHCYLRENYSEPIEQQSDECIDYIYSLIDEKTKI